jgi:uncharacterized protein YicC (UPF0701 family)
MIDRKLIAADYHAGSFRIPAQDIDSEIDRLATAMGARSRSDFMAKLRSNGVDYAKMRRDVEEYMAIQLMLHRCCLAGNTTTPEDLYKYYEKHKDEFSEPDRVELAMILVTDSMVAEKISQQLKADPAAFDEESTASLLAKITEEAVCNLVRSRETEGDELAKDISLRLSILKETLEKIIPLASALPQKQYEKLLVRLKELDLPANAAVAADDDRLLRELVLYADKLDVTEEITRLHSHFLNWDKALTSGRQEAVGRQLDFMVQETFREINTLGNKAACAEISPLIVIMKTELEKIREQVQNIE